MDSPNTHGNTGHSWSPEAHTATDATGATGGTRGRRGTAASVVKRGVPIEDYAARYTKLWLSRGNLVGPCPMHTERSSSFEVDPEKQRFFCPLCRVSGDVIDLFRALEGGTEADAISALAERFDIELPGTTNREDGALGGHDGVNQEFKEIVYGDGRRPAAMPFNTTDLGNAERLVARHGADLRYVHPWGKWLEYDGIRYRVDNVGGIFCRAKETARSIYGEAEKPEYAELRKELARHAIKSETRSRIEAMVALAESEKEIPVPPENLDADPWLLNVENGTIDLRTGELREHRRENLITKLAPVEYDPDAKAPTWEAFLERVLPSEELRGFVQRAVGYSLTGDTRERVLLILHGMGRNGKSTFLEAIREALGAEDGYAMKTPAETLMAKPAGGIPNDVARLKGARFVSASETEKDRRLAEALVKEITGNDTISARFMRAEWFDFKPTHKVWLATNHKPEIRGTDPAIWDRIRLVPFDVRIPDDEIDRELPEKLMAELPGILAWAVRGCLDWQREGLGESEEVRKATESYRSEMDLLASFIEERCVIHRNAEVKATPLYEAYKEWCEENGERFETQRRFGTRLGERGFEKEKIGGLVKWFGIGLLSGGPDPEAGPLGPSGLRSGMNEDNEKPREVMPEKGPKGPKGPGEVPAGAPENVVIPDLGNPTLLVDGSSPIEEGAARDADAAGGRRLTVKEVSEVQRLIAEGMSPAIARSEVIGRDSRGEAPAD